MEKRKTRLALAMWIIFTIAIALSLITYLSEGNYGIMNNVDLIYVVSVSVAILFWGDKSSGFTRFDKGCLARVLMIVIFWIFTQNHLITNILIQLLLVIAYFPIIIRLFDTKENSESFIVWIGMLVAEVLSLLSSKGILATVYHYKGIEQFRSKDDAKKYIISENMANVFRHPFCFVISSEVIVATPEGLENLEYKTIDEVENLFYRKNLSFKNLGIGIDPYEFSKELMKGIQAIDLFYLSRNKAKEQTYDRIQELRLKRQSNEDSISKYVNDELMWPHLKDQIKSTDMLIKYEEEYLLKLLVSELD